MEGPCKTQLQAAPIQLLSRCLTRAENITLNGKIVTSRSWYVWSTASLLSLSGVTLDRGAEAPPHHFLPVVWHCY